MSKKSLEHQGKAKAHAVLVTMRMVVIVHTAYILNLEEAEDAANTQRYFPIGNLRIHHVRVFGEIHQDRTAGIAFKTGIILVGQSTSQHLGTDILAPAQFLDQRDAVENLALHIPVHVNADETVVQELHTGQQIKRLLLTEVRHIGSRHT